MTTVAIIGAGPMGLATALALARRGHTPSLYDARPTLAYEADSRILALSQGSRDLLELLGAWPQDQATPIRRIAVSQRNGHGYTDLQAQRLGLPALGYVVSARELAARLHHQVVAAGIPIECDARAEAIVANDDAVQITLQRATGASRTITAHLAACCEGSIPDEAATVRHDYHQHALLCLASPHEPHQYLAHERFTPQGPLALLPCGEDYAVVWTVPAEEATQLMAAPDEAWLAALHAALPPTIRLTRLTERACYPLGLRMRRTTVAKRQVWLGNAAQTLHPVAGQGFNLALRDGWELADTLTGAPDPGAAALLERYAQRRRLDRESAVRFTDALVRGFSNDSALLGVLRGLGLHALDALPPLRQFVAKRMIFGARAWP